MALEIPAIGKGVEGKAPKSQRGPARASSTSFEEISLFQKKIEAVSTNQETSYSKRLLISF